MLQVIFYKYYMSSRHGYVCSGSNSYPNVGLYQCRSIIYTVTDHDDFFIL